MIKIARAALFSFGVTIVTTPAMAQTDTPRSFASCWLRPAPAPICRTILVTEAAIEVPFATTAHASSPTTPDFMVPDYQDTRATFTPGFLRNVTPRHAVGGLVAFDLGGSGGTGPVRGEVRYRRWLQSVALDLGAGVAYKERSDGSSFPIHAWGPSGAIGAEWKYIALDVRGEVVRGRERTAAAAFVGGRATSFAAPIALVLGVGVIGAIIMRNGI